MLATAPALVLVALIVAVGARVHLVSGESPFAGCSTRPAFTNAEAEPSLAVDPRNASRLVAAYQQDRYRRGGGARGIVAAVSRDGGRRWSRTAIPVSRCAGPSARPVPFASDPWVSVGPDGRVYVSTVSDVVSVVTSADWGASWSRPAVLRGGGLTDKPIVTADPTRAGTAYVVWSEYRRTNPPGTESDELLSVTHDGGRTWSAPAPVLRHATRAGPDDGQILVDVRTRRLYLLTAWVRDGFVTPNRPAEMLVQHSDDGGVRWSKADQFALGYTAPQRRGRIIRSSPQVPSFAIDRSGVLYAVWQDSRFSHGAYDEVLLTSSRDGGARWSAPRRISAPTSGGSLIPTVATQGSGHVAVLYLQVDRGSALDARWRLASSRDGAGQFADRAVSKTFALTGAPALTSSPLVPGGYFVGDYMGLTGLPKGTFGALFVSATGWGDDETDVFFSR